MSTERESSEPTLRQAYFKADFHAKAAGIRARRAKAVADKAEVAAADAFEAWQAAVANPRAPADEPPPPMGEP